MTGRVIALILASALVGACQKTPAPSATPAAQPAPAAAGTPAAAPKPVPATASRSDRARQRRHHRAHEFERAVKNLESQAGGPVPPDRRDAVYRQVLDQLVASASSCRNRPRARWPCPTPKSRARSRKSRNSSPTSRPTPPRWPNGAAPTSCETTCAAAGGDEAGRGGRRAAPSPSATPSSRPSTRTTPTVPGAGSGPRGPHPDPVPRERRSGGQAKARTEAQDVLASAKKGGDFAALGPQHSQDQGSAVKGGDLGFLARGQRCPPSSRPPSPEPRPAEQRGRVPLRVPRHQGVRAPGARKVPLPEVKGGWASS